MRVTTQPLKTKALLIFVAIHKTFYKYDCPDGGCMPYHNRTTHNRQSCRKTMVLSCHRCLTNTGVEKMNYF